MSSALRIRTPEGIIFAHRLAGPVPRCMAWFIDAFATLAVVQAVATILNLVGFVSPDLARGLVLVGYFTVSIGYSIIFEWFWRGQTLGKRICRLRVMDAEGLRLNFHQVVVRNLLRVVDLLPVFYMIGGTACLVSRRCQRLGDLAAGTIVVHLPRHSEPDLDQLLAGKFNSLRAYPHLEARLRQRVSADEARLALRALVRRDDLDPAARVALFSELAAHFKSLVTFPAEIVEAMPDEQYVRNVVDVLFRRRMSNGE
jgi:uncharacterized RDD family membrane protein YckC